MLPEDAGNNLVSAQLLVKTENECDFYSDLIEHNILKARNRKNV